MAAKRGLSVCGPWSAARRAAACRGDAAWRNGGAGLRRPVAVAAQLGAGCAQGGRARGVGGVFVTLTMVLLLPQDLHVGEEASVLRSNLEVNYPMENGNMTE